MNVIYDKVKKRYSLPMGLYFVINKMSDKYIIESNIPEINGKYMPLEDTGYDMLEYISSFIGVPVVYINSDDGDNVLLKYSAS